MTTFYFGVHIVNKSILSVQKSFVYSVPDRKHFVKLMRCHGSRIYSLESGVRILRIHIRDAAFQIIPGPAANLKFGQVKTYKRQSAHNWAAARFSKLF